jgi:hypothetical protein
MSKVIPSASWIFEKWKEEKKNAVYGKVCATHPPFFMFSKSSLLELEQRKASVMSFEKWGGGEGLCLHSQEGQDLCVCTVAEELIFNTSSQHQTVDLSNQCMTKDFLRDFHHGSTVHGGQETTPLTCT